MVYKRWLRGCLSILAAYGVLILMFAVFQRSMIYLPARSTTIEPEEAGLPLGQVHTIRVRADDQLELRGWHILPDGQTATGREECDEALAAGQWLVLYFSGNGGSRAYRGPEFAALTRVGAHVFNFDYRGYGDNPGAPSEERLAADARTIWDYATRERNVPRGRIVLFGESLGGGVAVRLAAELSRADTAPAGIILRSTFSSLVEVGAFHFPWLPVRMALVDRYDSIHQIPHVTCPILHVHGTRDSIIPISLGRRLFQAAPAQSSSGIVKTFAELTGADHNDVVLVAGHEYRTAIARFLQQLL